MAKRLAIPAEPAPEALTALVDTREQNPYDLAPLKCEPATLTTGDYSLKGLEHIVSIERKSLPDFLACCGKERERFQREVDRLRAYPVRAIVIETNWLVLERGAFEHSQITANQAMGNVLGLIAQGMPVLLASDHERAGKAVSRLLFLAARRRWREARELITNCLETEAAG